MIKKISIHTVVITILLGCATVEENVETPTSDTPKEVMGVTYVNSEVGNTQLTQEQRNVEIEHNVRRRNHFNDSDIKYSLELEKAAQKYANTLAHNGKFEHDSQNGKNGFGENLYAHSQDEALTISKSIKAWYEDEKPYYNYDDGSCSEGTFSNGQEIMCGHYTQVIWQESSEVGCATAQYTTGNFKGGYVYVCKYHKPGNIVGLKPYCTEYSTADLYSKKLPSFKTMTLSSKTFPIELVVEDREACTRKDNYNSAISFGEDMKSVIIKDFQIFNNGKYPNTLEFSDVVIGDNELKLTGINKNSPNKKLRGTKIYMNIKLLGETQDYYGVELDWNGYDASKHSYSRQMKAKIHK